MSNDENKEQKAVLKFVIETYGEQLQMAKKEKKPSKLNIDFALLNSYFKKKFNINYKISCI